MPNHAVVIGINQYPGITNLEGPCNDAREFLKWVTSPGPGNVAPENVHKVLSCEFDLPDPLQVIDAKPVSDQIEQAFNDVIGPNLTRLEGDRLYVFVSGHGMSDIDRPESTAIIAANATVNSITIPHFVITDHINFFRRSYNFKEILVFLDCCLDATAMRPIQSTGTIRSNPHPDSHRVKVFVANATLWTKKAFEKKFDGEVRGIFSKALMDALEKAPADNGKVTGEVVKNYIKENIASIAGDTNLQKPEIRGHEHEEILFYTRTDEQNEVASTAFKVTINILNSDGTEVVELLDGGLTILESLPVANGVASFEVAAGLYKIRVQGSDREALLEVNSDHEEDL
jgi:hypothetical protein